MGDKFEGVLVSDFYGAYNVYQGPHQRCWTHLLRDIHQLKERFPEHDGLAQWSRRVRDVYDQAQAYSGPDPGVLAGNGAPVPADEATAAVPKATMVHLPTLPGLRRYAHEGAVPEGGTLPA